MLLIIKKTCKHEINIWDKNKKLIPTLRKQNKKQQVYIQGKLGGNRARKKRKRNWKHKAEKTRIKTPALLYSDLS